MIPMIFGGRTRGPDVGDTIAQSAIFDSADTNYLHKTMSAGSTTTWTLSAWVKRNEDTAMQLLNAGTTQPYTVIALAAGGQFVWDDIDPTSVVIGRKYSNRLFRDFAEWLHIVCVWDSSNATSTDRMRVYFNGVRETSWQLTTDPGSSVASNINSGTIMKIGQDYSSTSYADAQYAAPRFIDGQALDPTEFGRFNAQGRWVPQEYAGTYGTNGFYLDFSTASATPSSGADFGKDVSGNANHFTQAGTWATNHQVSDTPTENYCTLDYNHFADVGAYRARPTVSDGALKIADAGGNESLYGTMVVHSGKWYAECTCNGNFSGLNYTSVGIAGPGSDPTTTSTNAVVWYNGNGNVYKGGVLQTSPGTCVDTDVMGIELDIDSQTVQFYKNGVAAGSSVSISDLSGPFTFCGSTPNGTSTGHTWNFGQRAWAHGPSAGFKALNSTNLPEPDILDPSGSFNVALYTGNSGVQSITTAVAPDLVWIKGRSVGYNHHLFDKVRGIEKYISSDTTTVETTVASSLTAFNSNGFSLGGGASGINNSGDTYVAWCWKEGAIPGFDIVTYTGNAPSSQNIAHNLGVVPELILVKNRGGATNWAVYSSKLSVPAARNLQLSSTVAEVTSTTIWNNTEATSSVFSVGNNSAVNTGGNGHVAYLFASVPGFSKVFSYTGNGSTDGPFIPLDLQSRFVLLKNISAAQSWLIIDTERGTYNYVDPQLFPNLSSAELLATTYNRKIDIVSNGIKIRDTDGMINTSGQTYIGIAFAEFPFKYSRAR